MSSILNRKNKPSLAYHCYEGGDSLPPLVFLGGFRSDMEGTKALFLEEQCKARAQGYLRFDYSGHGQSEGVFEECGIGDWTEDAYDIIKHCFDRPAILVGSSMGGWISLLLARNHPALVHSFIGIAAAPDFTTWMEEGMSEAQRAELAEKEYFLLDNEYGDPYVITKSLLDNGRTHCLLQDDIDVQVPVRLLQGKKDIAVPWQKAQLIKDKLLSDDVEIIYVEEGDHSLSGPPELKILNKTVEGLISS